GGGGGAAPAEWCPRAIIVIECRSLRARAGVVVLNSAQTARPTTRKGNALLFARNFFRHPRMLGSIVPSSRFLIRQLLQPINWARARVIVEYEIGRASCRERVQN